MMDDVISHAPMQVYYLPCPRYLNMTMTSAAGIIMAVENREWPLLYNSEHESYVYGETFIVYELPSRNAYSLFVTKGFTNVFLTP